MYGGMMTFSILFVINVMCAYNSIAIYCLEVKLKCVLFLRNSHWMLAFYLIEKLQGFDVSVPSSVR